jgi:hypothetical protein
MEQFPPPQAPGPPSAPPQQPMYLAPAQPSSYQQPAPPPVRRPNIIKRSLRFLLRRGLYVGVVIGRVLAPFKLALFITLPLLALVGVLTTALMWNRIAALAPPVARVESLPPASEVETFLEGQRTYDAEKMWNSFNSTFKARLMDRGLTVDQLKQQVEDERMSGQSYMRPVYIGGVPLKSGGAMYFYLINAYAPNSSGASPISYVFTVDAKGKIASVD